MENRKRFQKIRNLNWKVFGLRLLESVILLICLFIIFEIGYEKGKDIGYENGIKSVEDKVTIEKDNMVRFLENQMDQMRGEIDRLRFGDSDHRPEFTGGNE